MKRHPFHLTTIIAGLRIGLLVCAPSSLAQQSTGTIAGRVVDEQDGGIAGATVTARSTETGFVREVTTDENGLYVLNALPVGLYEVTAVYTGLARFDRDRIVVNVARTTDLQITLRGAALAETITVTAESPTVPVTSSTIGQVVEKTRIENLPL